ncbi:hypothetical protein MHBO_003627 [Bonamia ostreae]|uniref:Uncharacterized protein n=1 Tax=Bonamia ostreae TaxID=126728 RepID=A0ABV2AR09_9EUKA
MSLVPYSDSDDSEEHPKVAEKQKKLNFSLLPKPKKVKNNKPKKSKIRKRAINSKQNDVKNSISPFEQKKHFGNFRIKNLHKKENSRIKNFDKKENFKMGSFLIPNSDDESDHSSPRKKYELDKFQYKNDQINENPKSSQKFGDLLKQNDFLDFIPPDKNVLNEVKQNPNLITITPNEYSKIENSPNKLLSAIFRNAENATVTIPSQNVSSIHKRKHQVYYKNFKITSLAFDAQNAHFSLQQEKTKRMLNRRETKAKYGW